MIDPQLLRQNPDAIKRSQAARGNDPAVVDEAVQADAARRQALATFEALRSEQKEFGARVKAAPKEEKQALIAQAQELAAKVKAAEAAAREAEQEFTAAAMRIENVVIEGVPADGEKTL